MKADYLTYVFDKMSVTTFAYLMFISIAAFYVNGYTTRVSLLGFLIPHASKLALWSFMALVWLRPKFGWRFPLALLMLYSTAELMTNAVYVPVHVITEPAYFWKVIDLYHNYYFVFSNVFFILSIILGLQFMKGRFSIGLDWSILPFASFVAIWVSQGYVTDSTVLTVHPIIELYEFLWSVLFLTMAYYCFRPKGEMPSLGFRS